MLKKIYEELVLIRKELQAIRECMESKGTNIALDPHDLSHRIQECFLKHPAQMKY